MIFDVLGMMSHVKYIVRVVNTLDAPYGANNITSRDDRLRDFFNWSQYERNTRGALRKVNNNIYISILKTTRQMKLDSSKYFPNTTRNARGCVIFETIDAANNA